MADSQQTATMVILSLDYPPNDGGISRLAAGLSRTLLECGETPIVITNRANGREGPPRPPTNVIEVSGLKGMRDWQTLRALNHFRRDIPVLCTVWNPEATLALLAGFKRVSILAHGNEVMPYRGKPLKTWMRKRVLEHARSVICNSAYTESLVQDISPDVKTIVLNPAVDVEEFRTSINRDEARARLGLQADTRILLSVSRLDPMKGHDTVLRAIAALTPEKRQTLEYVIVGKGSYSNNLASLANKLGVDSNVRFEGYIADTALAAYYAAADLFVLCSRVDRIRKGMEGFGMVFTEAQATGLPVIGTNSGGIPDAIKEGEGGWLIAEDDVAELATHLERLYDDVQPFRLQGARALSRVEREFNWQNYAEQFLKLI